MATIEPLRQKMTGHPRECQERIVEIEQLIADHHLVIGTIENERMRQIAEIAVLELEKLELGTEIDLADRIRRECEPIFYWDGAPAESNADMDFMTADERKQAEAEFLDGLGLFAEEDDDTTRPVSEGACGQEAAADKRHGHVGK